MTFKRFSGLIIIFLIVTVLVFLLKDQLAAWKIDYRAVLVANAVLFVISVISMFLHIRSLGKPNPNAFVRSVMLGNVLKLFGLGAAALIYLATAGKSASTNAILAGLFLYLIYSFAEKRVAIRLSKSKKT